MIYSPKGVKADDVLKRITASTDEEILVVSSDREIASYAMRKGKAALSSLEFEAIVNKQLAAPADHSFPDLKDEDEEEDDRRGNKKGPARKLPAPKDRRKRKSGSFSAGFDQEALQKQLRIRGGGFHGAVHLQQIIQITHQDRVGKPAAMTQGIIDHKGMFAGQEIFPRQVLGHGRHGRVNFFLKRGKFHARRHGGQFT